MTEWVSRRTQDGTTVSAGEKTYTGDQMMFFRGGQTSAPRRGHATRTQEAAA
jgi:hypothetical protein